MKMRISICLARIGALMKNTLYALGFVSMAAVGWANGSEDAPEPPADLTELSLQDLMSLEVTSVSKKPESLSETSAAAFVITQEDLRRSGVTSIPEALRMVPGLQVARLDANKWAITARGFNGRLANKLLVLVDGRSVYSPEFSGVYWEVQDTLLEDVERIEVIRGPGATLWGANAVNGVINIITKVAHETPGGLATAGTGTEGRGLMGVRYGGKLRDGTSYRAYAKYLQRDSFVTAAGEDANDGWSVQRSGFRLDRDLSERESLMVQGDTYGGDIDQTVTVPSLTPPYTTTFNTPVDVGGVNLMGRWERIDRDNSDRSLAFYYERYKRNEPVIGLTRDTFDLDFQRRFAPSPRQEMVWGLGYRYSRDHFTGTPFVSMTPPSRSTRLFSGFIQDDIELRQDRLRLTVGSKFEHNDFSGFEVQPNVRLLYTPDPRRTLWGAISRAVRTPNRGEEDVRISTGVIPPGTPDNPGPLPIEIRSIGQRDRKSEELLAYEVGYRVAETERLFFDVAAFYNDYDHLRTYEPGAPFPEDAPVPHLVLPFFPAHGMKGQTYGIEVATDWQTADGWQVRAAYSYLQMQLTPLPGSSSTTEVAEGYSPHHQFSLRSSMDLPRNLELDLWLRYVDRLPTLRIGDYLTLDARLGWKPREDLEVTLGGQNLLDNRHAEFTPELYNTLPSQVQRGVYGKITWRF